MGQRTGLVEHFRAGLGAGTAKRNGKLHAWGARWGGMRIATAVGLALVLAGCAQAPPYPALGPPTPRACEASSPGALEVHLALDIGPRPGNATEPSQEAPLLVRLAHASLKEVPGGRERVVRTVDHAFAVDGCALLIRPWEGPFDVRSWAPPASADQPAPGESCGWRGAQQDFGADERWLQLVLVYGCDFEGV